MEETTLRLWAAGSLTETGLARAVGYGWITAAQFEELTGKEYSPVPDETAELRAYYTATKEALE